MSRFAKYLSPLVVNTLDFIWFPGAHHAINVAALGRMIVIGHACGTILFISFGFIKFSFVLRVGFACPFFIMQL